MQRPLDSSASSRNNLVPTTKARKGARPADRSLTPTFLEARDLGRALTIVFRSVLENCGFPPPSRLGEVPGSIYRLVRVKRGVRWRQPGRLREIAELCSNCRKEAMFSDCTLTVVGGSGRGGSEETVFGGDLQYVCSLGFLDKTPNSRRISVPRSTNIC